MPIRICLAGVSGKVGKSLARAIVGQADLSLVGAVARSAAGRTIKDLLGIDSSVVIRGQVEEALQTECDVLIDYTRADAVKHNVLVAVARGVRVVIGSSGLTDADFAEIDRAARAKQIGVFAAGNFAITAVLLMKFAETAARILPSWEIIDYASATKIDAPSGTARELASRLGKVRAPELATPISATVGDSAARGATLSGAQLHSVRLPGYSSSVEVVFGQGAERLVLRHESIDAAAPYVDGTLLAVRRVGNLIGVQRGLDQLLGL